MFIIFLALSAKQLTIIVNTIQQKHHCALCVAGKNVWEDIHPDSQDFVKDYLAQYPEVKRSCTNSTKPMLIYV